MRFRPRRRRRATGSELAAFEAALVRHLSGVDHRLPDDVVGYFDYLADLERFVFHGSNHSGISELSIERKSTDSRAFGRQEAVFATPDPHWAAFFALVDRENMTTISNGSVALSRRARTRWYKRDVVVVDRDRPFLRSGTLYVLPKDTFSAEPKLAGVLDTAQWVSPVSVRPLFALPLHPGEYPLARHIRAID